MKKITGILLIFLIQIVIGERSYKDYKVYNVKPNGENIKLLNQWNDQEGIDFWSRSGIDRESRIMVSPDLIKSFESFLLNNEMNYKISVEDVDAILLKDKKERSNKRTKSASSDRNFGLFWTYDEMNSFGIVISTLYPNLVKRDIIGKTIEGRDMIGYRISKDLENFGSKPIIFIDGGIHAREWASHMSVHYLIHQLIENKTITDELVEIVDWVIVPIANPDGYVYSFDEERLWRKNRHVVNYTCTGIDLNRNYGYVWSEGRSCSSDAFPGSHPFSEPETQALSNYMLQFKGYMRLYVSVHTYGNYVLYPFGFDYNIRIKNWKEHINVAYLWANAIKNATGQTYDIGNSATLLYTANGASDDYAAAYANADLAYTVELTGGGDDGFDYPQDMINDLVIETFLGFRQFGLYIGEKFKLN